MGITLDETLGPAAHACLGSTPETARLRAAFVDYHAGIWRFLRRLGVPEDAADDAAQHVFLIALQALPRIVEGCERAFLYSTAVRVAHGLRRKAPRELCGLAPEDTGTAFSNPEELTDQKRAREILDAFLQCLDVDARTVFVLFEIEGFTVPEIASVLGLPLGTAASRLRRGREHFQSLVHTRLGRAGRGG
ncbi:MAG TPA: sigma-70 family RNA polymerase sigma factor [Polyangiaceae bacterium]|nr:sigma-70 family RNA polymerase sigma factor [Polyangiaceae bacterium]